MKTRHLGLMFLISYLFLFLTGCGYVEEYVYAPEYVTPIPNPIYDSTINPNNSLGQMTGSINGEFWQADTVYAIINDGDIEIKGTKYGEPSTQIQLNIAGNTTNIYELSLFSESTAYYMNGSNSYSNYNGSITLDSIDTTNELLFGVFVIDVQESSSGDAKTISNGVFTNVKYFGSITNNSFSCEIDSSGTVWNADIVSGELSNGKIYLTGNSSSNNVIVELMIPDNMGAGVSSFTVYTAPKGTYTYNNTAFVSTSGTLVVNSHDFTNNIIDGTFDFVGTDQDSIVSTHSISSGQFSITYTEL